MLRNKLALAVFLSLPAASWAQDAADYRSDATVQATGSFVKETEENGVRVGATHSGGVLGTYRYYFHRNHGVEFNYGYTRNTQRFSLGGNEARLKTDVHEATAAYVVRLPMKRITPFALAGAGALVFDPADGGSSHTRAAFVYGAGADVNLTNRVFLRVQYRGHVYNSLSVGPAIVTAPERLTHRAQPSIGFGFRF